jgi:hypothetical protein
MRIEKVQAFEASGRLLLTLLVTLNIIYLGLRYEIGALITVILAVSLGLVANLFLPPPRSSFPPPNLDEFRVQSRRRLNYDRRRHSRRGDS